MLERFFIRPETVDRVRASWICEAIERYVTWLGEKGYADRNVYRRVPLLRRFGEVARERGATAWDDLPAHVDGFVETWVREHARGCQTEPARKQVADQARNCVEQMLRLAIPGFVGRSRSRWAEEPFAKEAVKFFDFLKHERGVQDATLDYYRAQLRPFEAYLRRLELHDLRALSPVVISAFVVERGQRLCRKALPGMCGTLRIFLRYLYREQLIDTDLSNSVESPRTYRLATLPRSISWDEVRRMLETVDRRTPCGKRDYAILLLLVTYGLRAREVVALTLDDLDWKRDRLRIPERKADHSTAYPLSPIVGAALVDYLQNGRPKTHDRHVFLRFLAPRTPLTQAAVSSQVEKYLTKAGITGYRLGSHTLRHTCVQRLVDSNIPFPVIGEYVGHRSIDSTERYTRIATEALREVAQGDVEEIL